MLELSMADKLRRTQFLGREFLTWLMFRATQDDGIFRDAEGNVVEVFFERTLTLDGENPAREMSTIKVDEPTRSEEVMLSLRLGKKVSRARLTLVTEGREYALVLDAASLTMRSIKLPDAPAMDPIENMVEKTEYCRDLEDVVHRLFMRYVRMRLDPDAWADEAAAIAGWLAGTPPLGEDDE